MVTEIWQFINVQNGNHLHPKYCFASCFIHNAIYHLLEFGANVLIFKWRPSATLYFEKCKISTSDRVQKDTMRQHVKNWFDVVDVCKYVTTNAVVSTMCDFCYANLAWKCLLESFFEIVLWAFIHKCKSLAQRLPKSMSFESFSVKICDLWKQLRKA